MDYTKYEGHTPGPWYKTDLQDRSGARIIMDEATQIEVAKASDFNRYDLDSVANANAALIADAPALLERCKRLEAALLTAVATIDNLREHTDGDEYDNASEVLSWLEALNDE